MRKLLADGIKETTATTGTGTLTLTQELGWVRFSDRFNNGERVIYSIRDGDNWEFGVGTYVASNQLARTSLKGTLVNGVWTNGGSPMSLSGDAVVRSAATEWLYSSLWRVAPVPIAISASTDSGGCYIVQANGITLSLPTNAEVGDRVEFIQGAPSITGLVINPGSALINGVAGSMTVDVDNFAFVMVYVDVAYGWKVDK